MASEEIEELRRDVEELQTALRSVVDSAHSTIHLLAYMYATRCLASPDPARTYKAMASDLLTSIGGDGQRSTGDEVFDAQIRGVRHHVSQFLLSLQTHIEANLQPPKRQMSAEMVQRISWPK